MRLDQKIKAGALQFVLFIGAVIAVLLMAFILLSQTHALFNKKTDVMISVVKSVGFGLETSLKKPIALGSTITLKESTDLGIEVNVKREFWGVFEKRTATTLRDKILLTKSALVGGQSADEMAALYVKDNKRPIILAGSSKITGTALLPEQGVKMGNIYGNSYNGTQLIYGNQKRSDSLLPNLSSELQQQIMQLTDKNYIPEGEVLTRVPNKELKNSFQSPTLIIRDRTVRLSGMQLAGNIIVSASEKIIVEASANLQDVILLAPEIVIENWVKGYFQAIASESISVGKKCELAYPTALVVHKIQAIPVNDSTQTNKQQVQPHKPRIYMDQYAKVAGIVMALEKSEQQQYVPQIMIEENAKVIGEVYSTKNLELKGRVNGNVTTDSFIALENGSVYQNHLYNGSINSTLLSKTYAGLILRERERTKKVVKWLY